MKQTFLEIDDDDDFLSQLEAAEKSALSTAKRRKFTAPFPTTAAAINSSPSDGRCGYTSTPRGTTTAVYSSPSDGKGGYSSILRGTTTVTATASSSPSDGEGVYTAVLRGSRSSLFQQQQLPISAAVNLKTGKANNISGSNVSGGFESGGGSGSCFKCGKSGHWARDCDVAGSGDPSVPEMKCPCGLGVCGVITAKTEKNFGRKFYRCPQREGGCGFFKWCSDHTTTDGFSNMATSAKLRDSFDEVKTNYGMSGSSCFKCGVDGHWANACPQSSFQQSSNSGGKFASSGSTCFKCGKEGHWANACPQSSCQRPSDPGVNATSGGSTCFKCGKEGHWSNACPQSSSQRPLGSGGKSAISGSTCYKCGKEGHWANACPQLSSSG